MRQYLAMGLVLIGVLAAGEAKAVMPGEMLADPALEARARALSKDMRCPVCQNQPIDDSNSELAHDLRVLVRQRLLAGDSDAQVRRYLADRYGDYVLLDPPFKLATLALWSGPPLFLLGAGWTAFLFYRRRPESTDAPPISGEAAARLERLLDESVSDRDGA